MTLILRPISLKEANAFICDHHRHNNPVQGAKFAVSAWSPSLLVGVAIVGRPVSRMEDNGTTAEITRVCTYGHPNAASFVISAAKRAAQAMGYRRVITRTLSDESGVTLTAAGWKRLRECGGGLWTRPSRPRTNKHPTGKKALWEAQV